MNIEIREMKEDDWDGVSRVYIQSLLLGTSTFQTECPTFEEWDHRYLKNCRYVLLVNGVLAGWCALSATSTREAYRGVVEVSIYLDHSFHNLGLGATLLNHLCRASEEKGYWCLCANIFSINKASIALHKKCGFREIGYREKIAKDRFGVWQNTTLLERRSSII